MEVWAAPGAPETLAKGGGRSPPPSGMVSRAPGAAQIPKMTDLRSLKNGKLLPKVQPPLSFQVMSGNPGSRAYPGPGSTWVPADPGKGYRGCRLPTIKNIYFFLIPARTPQDPPKSAGNGRNWRPGLPRKLRTNSLTCTRTSHKRHKAQESESSTSPVPNPCNAPACASGCRERRCTR